MNALGFLICCAGSGVFGWQLYRLKAVEDQKRRFERSIRRFDELCDITRPDVIDLRDGGSDA